MTNPADYSATKSDQETRICANNGSSRNIHSGAKATERIVNGRIKSVRR